MPAMTDAKPLTAAELDALLEELREAERGFEYEYSIDARAHAAIRQLRADGGRLAAAVDDARDSLLVLFLDEDLTDEKLREWSEGAGPELSDRLLAARATPDDIGSVAGEEVS